MNKLVSIFAFSAALFAGVILSNTRIPTIYEKFYPGFSEKEAKILLGRRVKNKFSSKKLNSVKCTINGRKLVNYTVEKIGGNGDYINSCNVVKPGEMGTIVALQKVSNGYFFNNQMGQNRFIRQ